MVFTNLQEREKDAFFSLLDEYFQSRPKILAALSSQGSNTSIGIPPAMTAAATGFVKRGFGGQQQQTPDTASHEQQDVQPVAGRVAAAAAAFSQHRRSTPGISPSSSQSGGGGGGGGGVLNKFDTSSLRNVLAARSGSAATPPSYNSMSAPPPVARRGPPQPEPEPEPEEEQGEWAEVLYDYMSNEPGDLNIRENQRILVTEKESDDWWRGEVDGKSGVFPASYVRLL